MKKPKVAIQGYQGSFHHIVARECLGEDAEILCCTTFRQLASRVENLEADYGVMAIENSIAGSILANYTILQNSDLHIIGEYYLPIRQHLIALPGVKLEDIEEVHSHPIALLQSSDYLDEHPWRLVEMSDTAGAARNIAEKGLRNAAAVAGNIAAEMFGLEILTQDIHTIKNNHTRFLIIQRNRHQIVENANKASLCFTTKHEQGSLLSVLEQLRDVNMTKIQSSPVANEPWSYMFHIDFEFDSAADYNNIIEKIYATAQQVHVYGIYRSGLNK
ncbi:MAG: prephenate dehydratase [Rikenellaceae bacterium]